MKILHVIDKFGLESTGMHGVAHLLASWLPIARGSGSDHYLCSLRGRNRAAESMERLGFQIHYLNCGKFNPLAIKRLARLVRQERPDILHLHEYGAYTIGRLVGGLYGIPTVMHAHVSIDYPAPVYLRWISRLQRNLTSLAVAVSESSEQFAIRVLGLRSDHVVIIRPGIDLRKTPELSESQHSDELKRLGFTEDSQVIGTVGRLDVLKGQRFLIEAMKEIIRTCPSAVCIFGGEGDERGKLEHKAAELGISDRVYFTGYSNEVQRWMVFVDVHVVPSLSEGAGLTAVEAMASGVPQVVSRVGGLAEIIRDGETGYLVPHGDTNALAEKVSHLLRHPDERARFGQKAKETPKRRR